jgi:hypothetical protein
MKTARRRKRSFQKARDKVEKREEELDQGMAIRGSIDREKKKQKGEEEKNKVPSVESSNLASNSNTNFTDKSLQRDENTSHNNNKDTTAIPEVFDSSKYDSMKEMKESADMKEGEGHLKEVLSSVEKEKPIEPITTDTKLPSMDTDSTPSVASATVTAADASPPSLEERAATLRSSKEVHEVDMNLEESKDKLQEEVIKVKDKESNIEPHVSQRAADPYTIFWQNAAESWNDFYIQYAKNASEMTKSWLDSFSNSWLFGYKRKKQ